MQSLRSLARLAGAAVALAAHLTASAQGVNEVQLQQACRVLQSSPLAPAELQVLLDVSRHATNSPALRSRAMAAYSLTLLLQGQTNTFDRATQFLRATFPDAGPLVTATVADGFAACDACAGSGDQTAMCPACRGTGTCKACAGTGKKATAACPACKGKGACALCAGKKKLLTPCPACKGTCLMFKPSPKIRENFNALLADILSRCEDNARFAERFGEASKETDSAKRIAAFQNLLQAFSHRADLEPARRLLNQTVASRDAQAARQLEQESLRQESLELDALRTLRDSADPAAAMATLSAYLTEHPKANARVELLALLGELTDKRNRQRLTKKIGLGALCLSGALVLMTCLKPLLFKKRPESLGPLPGMEKIDKTQFTDPLSLTSQESRSRAKNETAQVSFPEE